MRPYPDCGLSKKQLFQRRQITAVLETSLRGIDIVIQISVLYLVYQKILGSERTARRKPHTFMDEFNPYKNKAIFEREVPYIYGLALPRSTRVEGRRLVAVSLIEAR